MFGGELDAGAGGGGLDAGAAGGGGLPGGGNGGNVSETELGLEFDFSFADSAGELTVFLLEFFFVCFCFTCCLSNCKFNSNQPPRFTAQTLSISKISSGFLN